MTMENKTDIIFHSLLEKDYPVVHSSGTNYIKLKHPMIPNWYYWVSETGKIKSGHCVSQSFDIVIFFNGLPWSMFYTGLSYSKRFIKFCSNYNHKDWTIEVVRLEVQRGTE